MRPSPSRLVAGAALTVLGAISFFYQYSSWSGLFTSCPNKDTLLWDANMRLLQALDAVDDLRQGIVLPALRDLLASPTWPPLRMLFSVGILVAHGHPDAVADMLPTAIFFWVLIPLFAFFAALFSPRGLVPTMAGRLFYAVLFLLSLALLVGLADLPQYVFSSMLEVQGMFFFTWNAWAVYLIYRHYESSNAPVSSALKASFFFSGLGLYMTKYPYGILTGVALLVLEMIRHPGALSSALVQSLRARYRGWRLAPFGLLALAAVLILIGPHLAHDLVNTRLAKSFIYLALLWIFADFNHYLWRHRPATFPATTRLFYLWFVLPFATVLLSHPDRFGSLIQAQTDRVTARRTYLVSLFDDYFLQSDVFTVLVLGALLLAAIVVVFPLVARHFREKGGRDSLWTKWLPQSTGLRPEMAMVLFAWLNIFVMEFLTSNHQARYVFQVLPLMIFFHGALLLFVADRAPLSPVLRQGAALLAVLVLLGFSIQPVLSGLPRQVCFSGTDPRPFDAARRIAAWLPETSNAVLINEFHDVHSSSVGRAQATEIDMFLRFRVWGRGQLRTDSKYRFSDWRRFSEVLHVKDGCGTAGEESILMKRAAQVHVGLVRADELADPSGLCAVRYRIVQR